jgi:transcriptional regulator EpsA
MPFLASLSLEDIHRYHRVVTRSGKVASHLDVLVWLQGDMQQWLPHDIMVAAWGDFEAGQIQYDILSELPGVRTLSTKSNAVKPMLSKLYSHWKALDRKPVAMNVEASGISLVEAGVNQELSRALTTMNGALVHGFSDQRGNHDCIYAIFSTRGPYSVAECDAMSVVLPYVDAALRQVRQLPDQYLYPAIRPIDAFSALSSDHDLSEREVQIIDWVAMGKTNPEIGSILEISEFTVKNHLKRIFKKLDVYNRAQAVSKFKMMAKKT